MNGKHVFYAGPGLLPDGVYEEASSAVMDFAGTGVSVLSTSHRSREWGDIMDETRALWRELLDIPQEYEILLVSGGASMQFLLAPMNLLEHKAAYLDTGVWAHKAFLQAKGLGCAVETASSADRNYSYIPKGYEIPEDADYFHITTNNTVYGTEIRTDIDSPVPLVADMSSDILTRRIDVEKYSLIYGGAQKNAGTAGVGFAIVRRSALGKVSRYLPTLLDYRTYVEHGSMFNTPPVFSIFVMNRTLRWTREQGGVDEMNRRAVARAEALYSEIDRNALFRGTAAREDRSIMNVCFTMENGYENLEEKFLSFSKERDIVGIKGHRTAGGFRASIYNACTMDDIEALVACMRDFENCI